jgi:hypothetical protein
LAIPGETTDTGVIWTPGETTGRSSTGAQGAAIPGEASITVSGNAPGATLAAGGGNPFHFNTATRKLSIWTGSAWVVASGA